MYKLGQSYSKKHNENHPNILNANSSLNLKHACHTGQNKSNRLKLSEKEQKKKKSGTASRISFMNLVVAVQRRKPNEKDFETR